MSDILTANGSFTSAGISIITGSRGTVLELKEVTLSSDKDVNIILYSGNRVLAQNLTLKAGLTEQFGPFLHDTVVENGADFRITSSDATATIGYNIFYETHSLPNASNIYVDSAIGSDDYTGAHPDCPKATLEGVTGAVSLGLPSPVFFMKSGLTFAVGSALSFATDVVSFNIYGGDQKATLTFDGFNLITASGGDVYLENLIITGPVSPTTSDIALKATNSGRLYVEDCEFSQAYEFINGSDMLRMELRNCTFDGAVNAGAFTFNNTLIGDLGGYMLVENCNFLNTGSGSSTSTQGAAVLAAGYANADIVNCTFTDNRFSVYANVREGYTTAVHRCFCIVDFSDFSYSSPSFASQIITNNVLFLPTSGLLEVSMCKLVQTGGAGGTHILVSTGGGNLVNNTFVMLTASNFGIGNGAGTNLTYYNNAFHAATGAYYAVITTEDNSGGPSLGGYNVYDGPNLGFFIDTSSRNLNYIKGLGLEEGSSSDGTLTFVDDSGDESTDFNLDVENTTDGLDEGAHGLQYLSRHFKQWLDCEGNAPTRLGVGADVSS